jgi:hypothetical protein
MLSERDFGPLTLEVLPLGDCKLVGLKNNVLLVIDVVSLNERNFQRLSLIELHQILVRWTCLAISSMAPQLFLPMPSVHQS